jgi:hypothetical protein
MKAFLKDDLDYLKLVAGDTALGLTTGIIKARKERVII